MTHLTELQFSMLADGALTADENLLVEAHCESCGSCQARVAEFTLERQIMGEALSLNPAVAVPVFHHPVQIQDIAIVTGGVTLVTALLVVLSKLLFIDFFTEIFSWFASVHISNGIGVFVKSVLFISEEGSTMLDTMLNLILTGLILAVFYYVLASRRVLRGAVSLCFLAVFFGSLFTAPMAQALEFRNAGPMLTIGADENINDTVIVTGETVVIDGTINGDLIVFGRRAVLNGTVTGNLVVFTESVTISGRVEGSVISFSNILNMEGANVSSDFWGFANTVNINRAATIEGNATAFANTIAVAGDVGRDLSGFSQNIELSGRVEEDLNATAARINLIGNAFVGGDITYRGNNENALQQSPSATVTGAIEFLAGAPRITGNKYGKVGFYIGQALRLVSLFIAGMFLFWLFPSMKNTSLSGGTEGLKTGGIGLFALVCLPVLMGLSAITVVGLPFTFIGLFIYLIGLFFAKIIVAFIVGGMILSSSEKQDKTALVLLVGLVVVMIVGHLPWVGGILGFIILLLGLGLLTQQLLGYSERLGANKA